MYRPIMYRRDVIPDWVPEERRLKIPDWIQEACKSKLPERIGLGDLGYYFRLPQRLAQ